MKRCPKCNREFDDVENFCSDCGVELVSANAKENHKIVYTEEDDVEATTREKASTKEKEQPKKEESANKKVEDILNSEDHTDDYDEKDMNDNKGLCVLAYLGLLVLIPLCCNQKNSKIVKFHANQGFILFLCDLIIGAVLGGLAKIPYVGFAFKILGGLASVVCLIFIIIGIVNVCQNRAKELPIIGKFRLIK